jgi:putative glutamine amidotransferase
MQPGYMQAIEAAGGLPLMLPLTKDDDELEQIAGSLDGFLFTGGQDIAPEIYGERTLPECGEICPARDEMELRLLRSVVVRNKPLLGICRGIQIVSSAIGGTLYQDLDSQKPSELQHRQAAPYDRPVHEVQLLPGTPLSTLTGRDRLSVNSMHHQAIKRLPPRLAPMAVSADGLVEAAWMPDRRFVWLVQWHPEFLFESDEASLEIFRAFVKASK